MGHALWNGGSTRSSSAAATRWAGSSSGASTRRGRRHSVAALGIDPDGRRVGRRPGEAELLGAVPLRPSGRDGHAHHAGPGARVAWSGRGRDPDGDGPLRPDEFGVQAWSRRSRAPSGPALRLPAELAGQPGGQPDGDPRRAARLGARGPRCGPRRSGRGPSDGQGGSKNWATSSRHRVRPNQAASRLNGQMVGSSPSRRALDVGAGVGQVEDQPRALVGQVAEQGLVRSRVAGPPEDHGQLGLEQGPHGAGDQVDGIRPGAEHDPLGADLRQARCGQVAERRDLRRDPPAGVVRPAAPRSPGRGTAR